MCQMKVWDTSFIRIEGLDSFIQVGMLLFIKELLSYYAEYFDKSC
jgi:hypothetical protein